MVIRLEVVAEGMVARVDLGDISSPPRCAGHGKPLKGFKQESREYSDCLTTTHWVCSQRTGSREGSHTCWRHSLTLPGTLGQASLSRAYAPSLERQASKLALFISSDEALGSSSASMTPSP